MTKPDSSLAGYEVVVGVTGGIAAFKACSLVSSLVQRGAGVTVAGIRVHESEAFQFGVIERAADGSRILAFHEKNPDAPRLPDARREHQPDRAPPIVKLQPGFDPAERGISR